ncbi:alcohol dehydrogenase catalytic domain-containing protein [Streptomyces sp. NPDC096311]|uniref:alcohol dehydrogenase catalytic domain-containing protein n=1 Tax=Streptomyces sp. NPDC096311 TaxID=3366083 RepID=UPI00381EF37D
MKIYAFEEPGGPARELTVRTPKPSGHEVLVRLTHSGVCHSDVHLRDGAATGTFTYPLVAGHEMAGEVVAVGPDVTTAAVGDARLVYPWIGCGSCARCASDGDHRCAERRFLGIHGFGGYAEAVLVPHERYLHDIEGLDPAWAATLACSGLTAYSAVAKVVAPGPDGADDPVVVIGAGGVGLTAVAVLHARGRRRIVAVDVNDERLALARGLGASDTVNSAAGSDAARAALLAATDGGATAVIDLVNSGTTARLGFDVLREDGKLVHVGLFRGEMVLPTALMPAKRLTLQGSFIGSPQEMREVVTLARSGRLPQTPLVSRPLTAEGVNEALRALTEGTVPGRVVLTAT